MNGTLNHADQWTQRGFAAEQAGDMANAKVAYRAAVSARPQHAAAWLRLGVIARREGDLASAEQFMQRALQHNDREPAAFNSYGNLLLQLARHGEAEAAFAQATALKPDYYDGHYNHARALLALGNLDGASAAIARAVRLATPTASLLQLRAQVEEAGGKLQSALVSLDAAIQRAPGRAALYHNRGVLLLKLHRAQESLESHQNAMRMGLDVPEAHYNLGNTLQSLGQHQAAIAAYRQAIALDPGHALSLYDLARLRWRLGETDYASELADAVRGRPDDAALAGLQGRLAANAQDYVQAVIGYREAVRRAPDWPDWHDGLAKALARQGNTAAAVLAHDEAVALAQRLQRPLAPLLASKAATLLMRGDARAALSAATAACALDGADQYGNALVATSLTLLGDARAKWLNDYDRLIAVIDVSPPNGDADSASFNRELAQALIAVHHDKNAPIEQTLRIGTQTLGNLFDVANPWVDALKAKIAEAIDGYIGLLAEDQSHPFTSRKSAAWRFTDSWSSRLTRGGYHTNHVHPHGWLSSVYYVALPADVDDAHSQAGWLQFGVPDFDCGISEPARTVQPRVGRLVLFPSMFWHGTKPFHVGDERLTIAFDVVPDNG